MLSPVLTTMPLKIIDRRIITYHTNKTKDFICTKITAITHFILLCTCNVLRYLSALDAVPAAIYIKSFYIIFAISAICCLIKIIWLLHHIYVFCKELHHITYGKCDAEHLIVDDNILRESYFNTKITKPVILHLIMNTGFVFAYSIDAYSINLTILATQIGVLFIIFGLMHVLKYTINKIPEHVLKHIKTDTYSIQRNLYHNKVESQLSNQLEKFKNICYIHGQYNPEYLSMLYKDIEYTIQPYIIITLPNIMSINPSVATLIETKLRAICKLSKITIQTTRGNFIYTISANEAIRNTTEDEITNIITVTLQRIVFYKRIKPALKTPHLNTNPDEVFTNPYY